MRIGLDARSVGKKVCGVSRVASCIVNTLSEMDAENEYVVYTNSPMPDWKLGHNFRVAPTDCSRMNAIHDIKLGKKVEGDGLDLYHSLHSWLPAFIPDGVKTMVTIHDLFSVTDPEFFIKYKPFHGPVRQYFKAITKRSVSRADAIVTVSNYCKGEIVRHFSVPESKINVIYNAPGVTEGGHGLRKYYKAVDGDYLLFIGNCRSYKNVEVLIDGFAFYRAGAGEGNLKLVIAGNDPCRLIRERAAGRGIAEHVVFLSDISDTEVRSLYTHALAFILPSKQEGFGIPVLEAMSFGVPVIISDAEALIEVAGGAALVFKKDSPEELASAIRRMVMDKPLRSALVIKGIERAEEFSWHESGRQLRGLYADI